MEKYSWRLLFPLKINKNKQMKKILSILFVLVISFQVNDVLAQGCEGDDPAAGNDSLNMYKPIIFGYIQSQYDYT